MEIKLNEVSSTNLTNLNMMFNDHKITAILGDEFDEILNIIYGNQKIIKGYITYDGEKIDLNNNINIENIKKDIFYISENYDNMLFNINIEEDIKFYLRTYNKEVLSNLLKVFDLDISILKKVYFELSSSEKRKILLIISFLSQAKVLIIVNPTLKLDNKSIQTLVKELKKLKRQNKTIIIKSYDTDFLLEVSDKFIVIKTKNLILEGTKYEILSDEKLLQKVNLKLPNVLNFINKTKELKNIKLGYRDHINDLIKDIFRYAK